MYFPNATWKQKWLRNQSQNISTVHRFKILLSRISDITPACTVSSHFWMDVTRILLGAHYQFICCRLMPLEEENHNNKSIVELYYCCWAA